VDPAGIRPDRPDDGVELRDALTRREHDVLALLARGFSNKRIGERLGISEHTAKFHVGSVLAKLGAATRAEAVALGVRRGYVVL
jgi:DNA-binding CsgD family transcriptional regulator